MLQTKTNGLPFEFEMEFDKSVMLITYFKCILKIINYLLYNKIL